MTLAVCSLITLYLPDSSFIQLIENWCLYIVTQSLTDCNGILILDQ